MNEFTRKPRDPNKAKYKVIDGQVYVWDDDPIDEFGQIWIPICVRCRRGPLMKNNDPRDSPNGLLCPICDDDRHNEDKLWDDDGWSA